MDAIEKTDARVVFSHLEDKLVSRYEARLASGRLLVASASVGRVRPEVPVVSAIVNPGHIDELYGREMDGRVVDTGDSMAAIISVPLAPLHRAVGIRGAAVSSLQGWSDRGMHTVPQFIADTRVSDSRDITDTDQEAAVASDTGRILGISIGSPAGINFDPVQLHHGQWVRGHYARIDLELARDTTKKEVEELWRDFEAPEELGPSRPLIRSMTKAHGGKRWPGRHNFNPVKREHGSLLRTNTDPHRLHSVHPMRVQARLIGFDPEDQSRMTIEVAGDNVVQGLLAGGGLLDAMYARTQGYLG
jgi:aspartate-semialdehyde dehydrogenase